MVPAAPASSVRLRGAWVLRAMCAVAAPFVFVALGAAGAMPAQSTLQSWNFDTSVEGWSGVNYVTGSSCFGGGGGCLQYQGAGASMRSPLVTVTPGQVLDVEYEISSSDGSAQTVGPVVLTDGANGLAGGTDSGTCTVTGASYVICNTSVHYTVPSGVTSVALYWPGPSGVVRFDNVSLLNNAASSSGPVSGASGAVTYPILDLAALSAQVTAFWSFIAPAIYIIAGISLGGLIVAKVRHLI